MKQYKKPTVEIYALCGNETICGGCDLTLRDNANLNSIVAFLANDADGVLTKEESKNIFGIGEGCSIEIEQYCKFTSSSQTLSWS